MQRANQQLREEVRRLEETMAYNMVDSREMEAALRRVEDEARDTPTIDLWTEVHSVLITLFVQANLKLSKKLQEVNSHLQQQVTGHLLCTLSLNIPLPLPFPLPLPLPLPLLLSLPLPLLLFLPLPLRLLLSLPLYCYSEIQGLLP